LQGRNEKNNYYIGEPAGVTMGAYERAYREGLKQEMIEVLKLRVKEWREGEIDARDAMCDLEIYVQEIWGDE
jgi:hypothetical protein